MAFQRLKEALIHASILKWYDPDRSIKIHVDASGIAVGGVLLQEWDNIWHPVAYFSQKLNQAEQHYHTTEREELALVLATKHWQHYLGDKEFVVETDHKPNVSLPTQKELSKRQVRWAEWRQRFHMSIQHVEGKHQLADALSRMPTINNISTIQVTDGWWDTLVQATKEDKEIQEAINDKQVSLVHGVAVKDAKVWIPADSSLRTSILSEAHDTPVAGHLGVQKTIDQLQRAYWWPHMNRDVEAYVWSCLGCQQNKSSNQKPAGLLQPLPIPERRWEHVTLDLVTALPTTSQGHNAIVVFVDKLSKMIHIRPTTEKVTAPEVAQLFLEAVFAQHEMPTTLISDRGTQFTSLFWKSLFGWFKTKLAFSSAYHLESDGQTERANRTIEEMLRAFTLDEQLEWDRLLPLVEFAYNNSLNASTNVSPFYLMYGEHPQVPASLLHQKAITTKVAATEEFATRLQSVIQAAREKLLVAQNRQKQYANRKHRDMEYMVGDQVWLSTTNLSVKGNRKLGAHHIGPFSVAKRIGDVAYELSLPETMRHLHLVFHVSLLKPYISRPSTFSNPHPTPPLPQVVDDHIEYEVDRILQKRIIRRGRKTIVEYLVLWKGFPLHEATWEPIGNLTHCANILQKFENSCNEDVAS
ncbi:unnamed protein product [Calypogeia fissa]